MKDKFTMDELRELGLLKTTVNVGIKSEYWLQIRKKVKNGEYKSLNEFVNIAVIKKLETYGENNGKK